MERIPEAIRREANVKTIVQYYLNATKEELDKVPHWVEGLRLFWAGMFLCFPCLSFFLPFFLFSLSLSLSL
jgi:hypothetical protein